MRNASIAAAASMLDLLSSIKCNIFESERIFLVPFLSLPSFQEADFLLFIAYSSFEYQANACMSCVNVYAFVYAWVHSKKTPKLSTNNIFSENITNDSTQYTLHLLILVFHAKSC